MEWHDTGIVLSTRPLGESGVVAEVMTRGHGRHLGVVRGGRSRRLAAVLQAGNEVSARWRSRLDEQLGAFTIEPVVSRAAALMETAHGTYGLAVACAHMRLLAEREPHERLYEAFAIVLDHLGEPEVGGPLMVRFELAMLEELGFGLDLSRCAATGTTEDLAFVSPKSSRAVSRAAGEPYRDRLVPLPRFLVDRTMNAPPDADAVAEGFRLAGFFIDRHVLGPRNVAMPRERDLLVAALGRALAAGDETHRPLPSKAAGV